MNPKAVFKLVGAVLLMLGATMLISVLIALIYKEGDAGGIALSSIITIVIGLLLLLINKGKYDLNYRDGFAVVTFSWLAMSLAGALPFYLTGAIPTITDCFFESASGFTTTGASIINDIEALPHGILFWRSFTHWIGGMGIIVFSIAILPFLGVGGMQMFKAESPGPTADKLTPKIKDTAEILWGVYVLITVVEIFMLRFGGMNWFDSACHSFGTLATGGFSTKNTSIGHYDSAYIQYVIMFFMFLAGISFNLHFHAIRGKVTKYWKSAEFKFFFYVILSSIIVVTIERVVSGELFERSFRDAAFQVIAIATTTGYATADFELWHGFVQLLLVLLMFMGGMAGSTGGGIKAVRIQVLFKQARVELHKIIHPKTLYPIRLGKKLVEDDIVRNILAFFLLYILIMVAGSIVMSFLGLDLTTAVTSVISCLSNIGPGLGDIGPSENYSTIPLVGKWILSFLMIVGRLEIYTVIVLLTRTYWSK
jgi:trk/ktr system potassium uptake protein